MGVTKLSPGVIVKETDLTQFIPNTGLSGGAFVGHFMWGPVLEYTIISDSNELARVFGKPIDANYIDWYSVSNFLAYTGECNVIRVVDSNTAKNSTADGLGLLIKNESEFHNIYGTHTSAQIAARYPGNLGNSLKVSIADASTFATWAYKSEFNFAPATSEYAAALGASNDEIHVIVIDEDGLFSGNPGTILEKYAFLSKSSDAKGLDGAPIFYGNVLNRQSSYVRFLGTPTNTELATNLGVVSVPVTTPGSGYTTASVQFTAAPVGGVTATGTVTIVAGAIDHIVITNPGSGYLVAPTATLTGDGTNGVLGTVVTQDNPADNWQQTCLDDSGVARHFASLSSQYTKSLSGGALGTFPTSVEYITGWEMMRNAEKVDVSLLFAGFAGGKTNSTVVIQYIIDNIVNNRKDCVLFISPDLDDVLNLQSSQQITNVVAKRNAIARSSSYVVMDSGWKFQYDAYNDKFRWVPLNPDIAGLCAAVDVNQDPWWSPAGFTRGAIKNSISLAFEPDETARDQLYKNNINPVVTFAGDGTILYGDKTLQAKSSAFQYINVRRLFLILEKTISRAAKYSLFEFNDIFTRNNFKAIVTPYLKTVKGRRGIQDYLVVCDESNNTPEVIDRAEFVASIFIKPARSINYIELNFVAVRTGVNFNEVVGNIFSQ